MKKIIVTSLILVLVPTMLFTPFYIYLIYSSLANSYDYAANIEGKWIGMQYYYGSERVACKEENRIDMAFDADTITVSGDVLPEAKTAFSWKDSSTLEYQVDGETFTFLLSFDANHYLKIIVDGTPYIILLRRSEG